MVIVIVIVVVFVVVVVVVVVVLLLKPGGSAGTAFRHWKKSRGKRLWTWSMCSWAWARGVCGAFHEQALMSGEVGGGSETMEFVDAGR